MPKQSHKKYKTKKYYPETDKLKIIFSVSDYGFGPTSRVQAIKKKMDCEMVVLGSRKIKSFFDCKFIERKDIFLQLKRLRTSKSILISSLEPESIIAALKLKLPCIYVDPIIDNWERYFTSIDSYKTFTSRQLNAKLSIPEKHAFAVKHSDLVIVPRYTLSEKVKFNNIVRIGPIIDAYEGPKNENHLLVSFGGLIEENNEYAPIMSSCILSALKEINYNKKIIFCLPHKYLPSVRTIASKYNSLKVILGEFDREKMQELERNADLILTSPGLNVIFESFFYNKKMIILPEWNHSHQHNLERLLNDGLNLNYFTWEQVFCENKHGNKLISKTIKEAKDEEIKKKITQQLLLCLRFSKNRFLRNDNHIYLTRLGGLGNDQILHLINSFTFKRLGEQYLYF